jgi:hypothetical protein
MSLPAPADDLEPFYRFFTGSERWELETLPDDSLLVRPPDPARQPLGLMAALTGGCILAGSHLTWTASWSELLAGDVFGCFGLAMSFLAGAGIAAWGCWRSWGSETWRVRDNAIQIQRSLFGLRWDRHWMGCSLVLSCPSLRSGGESWTLSAARPTRHRVLQLGRVTEALGLGAVFARETGWPLYVLGAPGLGLWLDYRFGTYHVREPSGSDASGPITAETWLCLEREDALFGTESPVWSFGIETLEGAGPSVSGPSVVDSDGSLRIRVPLLP